MRTLPVPGGLLKAQLPFRRNRLWITALRSGDEEIRMSIRKMIALHPDVQGHVNQPLGDAAHHLMYCARMCVSCADACGAEQMDMTQCIRICLDCADICEATGKLAVRRSGSNEAVLKEMLEVCARACDACASECEKHDHEHCKLCAQICRECADDCRKASVTITPEQ
ncbi:MAG: four-helix bundle copper-binding protein [Sphingomicrobium sp.]